MAGVNVGRSGSQGGLGKRDARIQPISKSKIHFCCFTHLVYPALQSFNLYSMVSMKNGWRLLQIQLEVNLFLLRGVQLWPQASPQASNAHVYGMRRSSLMRALILQADRMPTAHLLVERQIETGRISPRVERQPWSTSTTTFHGVNGAMRSVHLIRTQYQQWLIGPSLDILVLLLQHLPSNVKRLYTSSRFSARLGQVIANKSLLGNVLSVFFGQATLFCLSVVVHSPSLLESQMLSW